MEERQTFLESSGSEDQVKFNFGEAMAKRVSEFLTQLELSLMNWDLRTAMEICGALYNEVEYKINEEEDIDDIKTIHDEINMLLEQYPTILDSKNNRDVPVEVKNLFRLQLQRLDRRLRRIIHQIGMGMPVKGEQSLF